MRRLRPMVFVATALTVAACVAQPYTAASYRNVDTSIVYTIICHNGKKTLRVPAEEWPTHKAHYDYRGPCRPRGIPNPRPEPKPKHTHIAYDQRARRAAWSEAEWERHLQARALYQVPDSLSPAPRK